MPDTNTKRSVYINRAYKYIFSCTGIVIGTGRMQNIWVEPKKIVVFNYGRSLVHNHACLPFSRQILDLIYYGSLKYCMVCGNSIDLQELKWPNRISGVVQLSPIFFFIIDIHELCVINSSLNLSWQCLKCVKCNFRYSLEWKLNPQQSQ